MSTIFQKIIDREIPAEIVYEDDYILAILDIKPANHGHTLVIPKQAFTDALSGDAETLARMMVVGQKIALALTHTLACDGVNLIMNNGEAAGQEVMHAHLHVIPRFYDDGIFVPVHRKEYDETEAKRIVGLLQSELQTG
jgi:histidine triad (HIT) family protein